MGDARRKLTNFGWAGAEQMVRIAIGFVVMTVVARHLGPDRFAIYTYLFAIFGIVAPFARCGQNVLLVRELATGLEHAGAKMGVAFALSSLFTGLAIGACSLFLLSDETPVRVTAGLIALAAIATLVTPGEIFQYYLRATERLDLYSKSRIFVLVAIACFTLLAALNDRGLGAFVALRSIEAVALVVAGLVAFCFAFQGSNRLRVDGRRLRVGLANAWPIMISGFGTMVLLRLDQVMLGSLSSQSQLGLYGVAVRVAEVANVVIVALGLTLLPAVARNLDDEERSAKFLQRLFDVYVVASLPAMVTLVAITFWLLVPTFGPDYAGAVPMTLILLLSTPFFFLQAALMQVIAVRAWRWEGPAIVAFACLANFLLNLWLIPRMGGRGAAIATVISYALQVAVLPWVFTRSRSMAGELLRSLFLPAAVWRIWSEQRKVWSST